MRSFVQSTWSGLVLGSVVALGSCGGDDATGTSQNNGGSSSNTGGSNAAGSTSTGGSSGSMGSGGSASGAGGSAGGSGGSGGTIGGAGGNLGGPDSGSEAGATDPCAGALFCEKFDDYAAVTNITNNQRFGPWHAALQAGATMNLDGMHKMSGSSALHVHLNNTVQSGGRLLSDGNQPIFASKPTHIYGRMMMYIDANGTSIHWTFFGVSGNAEPSSPVAGRNAQYIMSSLPRQGMNTYSFVYGLSAMEGYRDCSSQSRTTMPSAWACISFEMDSVARKLRMYKDGAVDPILSIDDHGTACVQPTPVASPWYGPSIAQLFVGAWSFHPMNAPLDVWIDDVVVDTKPVTCAPP